MKLAEMKLVCSEQNSKAAPPSVRLEIFVEKGGEPLKVRVKPREVSPDMALLEVDNPWFSRDPGTIQGKKAILYLTDPEGQESLNISGTILVTINQPGRVKIGMRFAKPDKQVRKNLENLLTDVPGDLKRFWELWDDNHLPQKSFLASLRGLHVGKIIRSFMTKKEGHISESNI